MKLPTMRGNLLKKWKSWNDQKKAIEAGIQNLELKKQLHEKQARIDSGQDIIVE
jgi:hypothetical protein